MKPVPKEEDRLGRNKEATRSLVEIFGGGDAGWAQFSTIEGKLFTFFENRGFQDPTQHVDETLLRLARLIQEAGEPIRNMSAFAVGVARRVASEAHKADHRLVSQSGLPAFVWDKSPVRPDTSERDLLLDALDHCLRGLDPKARDFILDYHRFDREGKGQEKVAAKEEWRARLSVSKTALKVRAHSIRRRLERCVQERLRSPLDGKTIRSNSHLSDGGGQ